MSEKSKTSSRVASEASDILRERYSRKPKSVAGSALSQAASKKPEKGSLSKLAASRYYTGK